MSAIYTKDEIRLQIHLYLLIIKFASHQKFKSSLINKMHSTVVLYYTTCYQVTWNLNTTCYNYDLCDTKPHHNDYLIIRRIWVSQN